MVNSAITPITTYIMCTIKLQKVLLKILTEQGSRGCAEEVTEVKKVAT